ncbi:hypothetical protein BpHYR1_011868, partial [Brachionus plicatilis]
MRFFLNAINSKFNNASSLQIGQDQLIQFVHLNKKNFDCNFQTLLPSRLTGSLWHISGNSVKL